jgi:membrane-associated protein
MSILEIANFLIHIDKFAVMAIETYGLWTYLILFLIIFVETGVVIAPFLPGDSLIFIAGAVTASSNTMNIFLLFILLCIAAIAGDTLNYWVGHKAGKKLYQSRFFRKDYLKKTEEFYHKHGGKTIILARFIPIIRTFAPFVAGVGGMDYTRFLAFNVVGGISWVFIFLMGGYFFGNIPIVQNNLTLIIWLVIFVSLIPPLFQLIKSKIN